MGEWGGWVPHNLNDEDWAKIKAEIKSLDPKLTPKNSRAEFPSPKILTMD